MTDTAVPSNPPYRMSPRRRFHGATLASMILAAVVLGDLIWGPMAWITVGGSLAGLILGLVGRALARREPCFPRSRWTVGIILVHAGLLIITTAFTGYAT